MLIRFYLCCKQALSFFSCQILAVVEIKTCRSIIAVDLTISDGAYYTVQKAKVRRYQLLFHTVSLHED